ncbi:MAG: MFS transporter [Bacteroidaceae bacterium]|nr:MFS transporter [Bacteroidaceae bacterium]
MITNAKTPWSAIIMMIAMLAMIAFVTNLCAPMDTILRNQFNISDFLVQTSNTANYVAYLLVGIPCGLLMVKFGYKRTALIGLAVGLIGIGMTYLSGVRACYWCYLAGVFISGMCVCILNAVVNPVLNTIGGGGKNGNQLLQTSNAFNSGAAIVAYALMGSLMGDTPGETTIESATPALVLAASIFLTMIAALHFIRLPESPQPPITPTLLKECLRHRHFVLGCVAIFLYMGLEIGIPVYIVRYLTEAPKWQVTESMATQIALVYWLMMFVGRSIGGSVGGFLSSRKMVSIAAGCAILLLLVAIVIPSHILFKTVCIDWYERTVSFCYVPMGIAALIVAGVFTSVMWGGIYNMAVEGLGVHTSAASGLFMTMVCGCAVLTFIQDLVADYCYIEFSLLVPMLCTIFILYYALYGSKRTKE